MANSSRFSVTTNWQAIQTGGEDITAGTFSIFGLSNNNIGFIESDTLPSESDAPDFFIEEAREKFTLILDFGSKLFARAGSIQSQIGVVTAGQTAKSFDQEVAAGRIPGIENVTLTAKSSTLNPTISEVWGGDAPFVFNFANTAETWEVFSTSDQDKAGGSGIREVTLEIIDDTFAVVFKVITLNGVTPVSVPVNNNLFVNSMNCTDCDPGNKCAGDVQVCVTGGGDQRRIIKAGENSSRDGVSLVPAGVTWFLDAVFSNVGKGQDVGFVLEFTNGEDGVFVEAPDLSLYQQVGTIEPLAVLIAEKSFVRITATASNSGTSGTGTLVFRQETNR